MGFSLHSSGKLSFMSSITGIFNIGESVLSPGRHLAMSGDWQKGRRVAAADV